MKKCPYGRGILGGLIVGAYGWLIGGLVWMKLFGAATQAHSYLWRPAGDPLMMKGMIAAYLVFGVFYSLLFAKLSPALSCTSCRFTRGLKFGFLAWLPFGFACGLFWYTLSPISPELLYAAWLDKALLLIGGGFILSAVYGETLGVCDAGTKSAAAPKKKSIAKKKKK